MAARRARIKGILKIPPRRILPEDVTEKTPPITNNPGRISFSFGGSGCESEEDSKKSTYSRVRNDSVCSVASVASTHVSQASVGDNTRKVVWDRKVRKTPSKRMLEARREFAAKCEGGKPDRQKLTMLDLIFYNPTTNPMSEKTKKTDEKNSTASVISPRESISEELEDDPVLKDHVEKQDEVEEDAMPVPQIKIGPNGEIIIDEKSLVIENQSTKINRQLMQRSEIVDGDLDVGVGYKRSKRPKDWTKSETIRFYNALNSIGTDFMLMCELFPQRTRKELKMKFKKEEKLNRQLVDKALTQPRQFDMQDLFKELEDEQEEAKQKEKMKEELQKNREMRKNVKYTQKKGICIPKDENEEPKKKKMKVMKSKKRSTYDYVKGGILSVLNDSEDEGSTSSQKTFNVKNGKNEDQNDGGEASDEDSEDEVVSIGNKPTRSGRMPKLRQASPEPLSEEVPKRRRVGVKKPGRPPKVEEKEPEKPLEPGSIMIISSTGPAGEPVYQVYMVTQGQGKTEINLGQDMIENLTQNAPDQQIQSNELPFSAENILTISSQVEEPPVMESNVTIAEDGGDSLRPTNNLTIAEDGGDPLGPTINHTTGEAGGDSLKATNNLTKAEDGSNFLRSTINLTIAEDGGDSLRPTNKPTILEDGSDSSIPTSNLTIAEDGDNSLKPTNTLTN